MIKISKALKDAVIYSLEHPEKSATAVAAMFKTDRHSIIKHKEDYKKYIYFYNNEYYYLTETELKPIEYFLKHRENSLTSIAKLFKINPDTIKRRLAVIGESYERIYSRKFNRNAFNVLKSEEDAYWLGFLLADGYINEDRGFIKLKLGQQDKEHILKFMKYMQEESLDSIKTETGGAINKDNICYSIEFDCRNIVNNLVNNFNIRQNKSGKEQPLNIDNEELKRAYVRGMIDGDGHIENGKFNYAGSLESCQYMKDYFQKFINYKKDCNYIYKHGTIYSFELKNTRINEALKYIYKDAKIYLNRKYQTVQNIK